VCIVLCGPLGVRREPAGGRDGTHLPNLTVDPVTVTGLTLVYDSTFLSGSSTCMAMAR
jgi:hypothetical protein